MGPSIHNVPQCLLVTEPMPELRRQATELVEAGIPELRPARCSHTSQVGIDLSERTPPVLTEIDAHSSSIERQVLEILTQTYGRRIAVQCRGRIDRLDADHIRVEK